MGILILLVLLGLCLGGILLGAYITGASFTYLLKHSADVIDEHERAQGRRP